MSLLFRIFPLFFYVSLGFLTLEAFQQELWLYLEDGNGLDFNRQVPDTSVYSLILPRVNTFCARGIWFVFREENFRSPLFFNGLGLPFTENVTCGSVNVSDAKSFRYWGASDTNISAISLYTEELYSGEEILVTGTAYAGITKEIKSLAVTGSSHWTLFEGLHLDGKSICYRVPVAPGYYYNFNQVKDLKLTRIRSVFKGCDLDQVQHYRDIAF